MVVSTIRVDLKVDLEACGAGGAVILYLEMITEIRYRHQTPLAQHQQEEIDRSHQG